jgi:hypothetical protein
VGQSSLDTPPPQLGAEPVPRGQVWCQGACRATYPRPDLWDCAQPRQLIAQGLVLLEISRDHARWRRRLGQLLLCRDAVVRRRGRRRCHPSSLPVDPSARCPWLPGIQRIAARRRAEPGVRWLIAVVAENPCEATEPAHPAHLGQYFTVPHAPHHLLLTLNDKWPARNASSTPATNVTT